MGAKNKAIDAYVASSADFARPILRHIRALVHKACPEVEEVIKWGFPHFDYKGMMCSMAAFKGHCAMSFWKAAVLPDPHRLFTGKRRAMGHFGRITSLDDLPADRILLATIKEAARLNETRTKLPSRRATESRPAPRVPAYLTRALKANPEALQTFRTFSPGKRRDYVEWLEDAKTEATRRQRLEIAVQWMAEGKPRNWKYMKPRKS